MNDPSVTKKKIPAKIALVLRVKTKNVSKANPHTIKYRAIAALYAAVAAPSAAEPVVEYAFASSSVGRRMKPKLSQNT